MPWYKNNKNEWKQVIDTVSLELKKQEIMIEKDVVQSMFLYELSKSSLPFVFKGGTSLSKAYQLIDRFSEDIDLSLTRAITDSEKRRSKETIISIANNLGLILKNPEDIKSRYDYNKYIFEYESLFSNIKSQLIIETSYYQNAYPVTTCIINSYVGKYCLDNNISLPIEFKASSFKMTVQSLERTFIDKVFAVCDYKIINMMDRSSRHLYDIAKILPNIELNDGLKVLIAQVRKDRMNCRNNPSADNKYNITNMLSEIIKTKFYEKDYKSLTEKLLYEKVSYEEAINKGIKVVIESKTFNT